MKRKDVTCDPEMDPNNIFRMNRRTFVKAAGLTAGALAFSNLKFIQSAMGAIVVQTPLNSTTIPQFVDPLPLLSVQGGPIDTIVNPSNITLNMQEFRANILPTGFLPPAGWIGSPGTWVWGYRQTAPAGNAGTYIGPVIVAKRDSPTEVTYVNGLGSADPYAVPSPGSNLLAYTQSTDQTLHWADPLNNEMNMCAHSVVAGVPPSGSCSQHYAGPIPACAHLHGGEVPPVLDGGPDAWYSSNGSYVGHGYYTKVSAVITDLTTPRSPSGTIVYNLADKSVYISNGTAWVRYTSNQAVYSYPNKQEAAPIWFHDHTLGATRLNVYAGLAGAYLIVDPNPTIILPGDLNDVTRIIPVVIQDRMFDTNGQLFFPNMGINPEHPFWVPEFIGDTIVVNGKTWPFLDIEPARYRFLFLNGSNARSYVLGFQIQGPGVAPAFWQIATDGGYLDAPAMVPNLIIMPGERADVIIDFSGFAPGTTITMTNSGKAPYPGGRPPQGATVGQIMQFRVKALNTTTAPKVTYNPAGANAGIRGGVGQMLAIKRLVDPVAGTLATGVIAQQTRELTLNEVIAPRKKVGGIQYPGGPVEILVNNTSYEGKLGSTIRSDFTPITVGGMTTYYSETPKEGETEVWEIVNLTADAHPMHLHLVQFQLMNRQNIDIKGYTAAYNAAFPGGLYIPAYGPPLDYKNGNPRALGGNPDISMFLLGAALPPAANEAGWKDTIMAPPGMVTRIAVRWAPTDIQSNSPSTDLNFPFDPDGGHGYVWHCHIIDHEDNEMMRPTSLDPKGSATNPGTPPTRTYNMGTDY